MNDIISIIIGVLLILVPIALAYERSKGEDCIFNEYRGEYDDEQMD